MTLSRADRFILRKQRTKSRIVGRSSRHRISVYRSNKFIYAQIIDDAKGRTVLSVSSLSPEIKKELKDKKKTEQAKMVGEQLAKKALASGVTEVVFDRSGYRYHGRVKSLADAIRAGGLKF